MVDSVYTINILYNFKGEQYCMFIFYLNIDILIVIFTARTTLYHNNPQHMNNHNGIYHSDTIIHISNEVSISIMYITIKFVCVYIYIWNLWLQTITITYLFYSYMISIHTIFFTSISPDTSRTHPWCVLRSWVAHWFWTRPIKRLWRHRRGHGVENGDFSIENIDFNIKMED